MVATARGARKATPAGVVLAEGWWSAILIVAFAAYYVAPGRPLSLLLLAVCAVLCYLQLPLAVSLVPLAVPFFMLPKHLGRPNPEFALGETAIALCAAAFVVRLGQGLLSGDREAIDFRPLVRRDLLTGAVALFLVAVTLSTLTARYHQFAFRYYRWVILEPIAYYALVVLLLRDARSQLRALYALAGAGLLVALLGLGQRLFRPSALTGTVWTGTVPHPLRLISSVYGSPDNLGLFLDRAIPVALVLGLIGSGALGARRAGATLTPAWAVWAALLPLLAIVPMALAVLLSGSRGAMIVAPAVCLLAALLWRGRLNAPWTRAGHLELVGLLAVLVGVVLVLARIQHGLSTIARVWLWQSALAMIRDHPVFGVGPDNFLYYYFYPRYANDPSHPHIEDCVRGVTLPAKHYMNPLAWRESCLSHPHNVALDAWLSTGLLGLVALALVVVGFAVLARRNVRVSRDRVTRGIQLAAVAVVAATLLHGLVDNSIFVPDLAVAFWLALALTRSVAEAAHRERRPHAALRTRQ